MGNLCNCCSGGSSSYEDITPDRETVRQQQIAAAEKRMQDQQRRGIGNIQVVERQRHIDEHREQREREAGQIIDKPDLKWQVN